MTPLERVLIISDCTDIAFAEMRGAIYAAARQAGSPAPRVEPLVPVRPFSVLNAGFVLRLMAESYGSETLLMFIMNSIPERTERIVGRTKDRGLVFEGTNTGAAGWLVDEFGVAECHELHDPGFVPFGGKFVHAPAVGRLMAGAELSTLGSPFPETSIRRVLPAERQIVHIDNFGNAKFRLTGAFEPGQRLRVTTGTGFTVDAVYGRRMMAHPDGTWVVYPGSSLDLHELGQVRRPGLLATGVSVGDVLDIATA